MQPLTPSDSGPLIAFLVPRARTWISGQREYHRPLASELIPSVRAILREYFDDLLLGHARVRQVSSIENPSFYAELQQLSSVQLIDFRQSAGITYRDTILVNLAKCDPAGLVSLLFHEMVHVVQYARLGVGEFARQYVKGWVENGMEYKAIPLEAHAYALQERFDRGEPPFSVVREVNRELS